MSWESKIGQNNFLCVLLEACMSGSTNSHKTSFTLNCHCFYFICIYNGVFLRKEELCVH